MAARDLCLDDPRLCKLRKLIISESHQIKIMNRRNQLPLDCLRLVSSGSLEALLFAMSHMALLSTKISLIVKIDRSSGEHRSVPVKQRRPLANSRFVRSVSSCPA